MPKSLLAVLCVLISILTGACSPKGAENLPSVAQAFRIEAVAGLQTSDVTVTDRLRLQIRKSALEQPFLIRAMTLAGGGLIYRSMNSPRAKYS